MGTAYVRTLLGISYASSRLENLEQFWGHKSSGSVVALPSPCPRSRPLQRAVDASLEAAAPCLFSGVWRLIHLTGLAAVLDASLRLVLMTRREGIGRRGYDVGGDQHINVLSRLYVFYAFYLSTISPRDIQACFVLPQRGTGLKGRAL